MVVVVVVVDKTGQSAKVVSDKLVGTSLTVRRQLLLDLQSIAHVVHVRADDGADVRGNEPTHQPVPAAQRVEDLRSVADQVGEEAGGHISGGVQRRAALQTEGHDEAGEEDAQADGDQRLGRVQVGVVDDAEDAQLKESDADDLVVGREKGRKVFFISHQQQRQYLIEAGSCNAEIVVQRMRSKDSSRGVRREKGRSDAIVEHGNGTVVVGVR